MVDFYLFKERKQLSATFYVLIPRKHWLSWGEATPTDQLNSLRMRICRGGWDLVGRHLSWFSCSYHMWQKAVPLGLGCVLIMYCVWFTSVIVVRWIKLLSRVGKLFKWSQLFYKIKMASIVGHDINSHQKCGSSALWRLPRFLASNAGPCRWNLIWKAVLGNWRCLPHCHLRGSDLRMILKQSNSLIKIYIE